MDHHYIEENNLVERYVLGRLPAQEQVRFEEHFAECGECLEQLELAGDLDTALRAAAAEDAAVAVGAGFAAAAGRGPKIAEPTRTAVAPNRIAAS